jgi:hypothetical protein
MKRWRQNELAAQGEARNIHTISRAHPQMTRRPSDSYKRMSIPGMQRVYVYAEFTQDPVTMSESVWTRMVSQWKPRGSWNIESSRAPRRQRVATMHRRKARIPLGVQVQWDDRALLVDFNGGEHGGGS